jgi:hypothetical protein
LWKNKLADLIEYAEELKEELENLSHREMRANQFVVDIVEALESSWIKYQPNTDNK